MGKGIKAPGHLPTFTGTHSRVLLSKAFLIAKGLQGF
jgi:hypothetical protein